MTILEFEKLKTDLHRRKQIQLLYRGDSLASIYKRFGVIDDNTTYNKNELLKRIFLIGDKSKYFYKDEVLKLNQYPRDIGLTNSDDLILEGIFYQINAATGSDKEYLQAYFKTNKELAAYFADMSNKIAFINSINSTKEIFRYRNYYLTILHQLYYIEYRNNTHFVSTTSKRAKAMEFAGKNGIIIHCWQPVQKMRRLMFKSYNLPRQVKVAFADQYETSLTAGILPHFIIGIEFLNTNEYYYNSNIIDSRNSIDTFMFGLDINQDNFFEEIKKTRFRKSFILAGRKYRENNNGE